MEVGQKKLEAIHEVMPAAPIALLVNPTNPSTQAQVRDVQAAARFLGLDLQILHASVEREFDVVFANLGQQTNRRGLSIAADPFFSSHLEQLAALTLRYGVPAIHQFREFAAAGGLMSYGANRETPRLAGIYTGRILKGEKPADLPVQQATKIELIINLKTAKALGITVPLTLRGRADEVIE